MATVYGSVGDDTVNGYNNQNDYVFGGPEFDTWRGGGAGRDNLYGLSGNDFCTAATMLINCMAVSAMIFKVVAMTAIFTISQTALGKI